MKRVVPVKGYLNTTLGVPSKVSERVDVTLFNYVTTSTSSVVFLVVERVRVPLLTDLLRVSVVSN